MYFVYVLYSITNNKFYIGFTDNLERRISEHKKGIVHTTARFGQFKLVYFEACKSIKDTQDRERQLKTGFDRGYLRRRLKDYLKNYTGV